MEKNRLHTIKTSGFKVPKDYFSNLDQQILSQVKLKDKVSNSGFEVPTDYFESFDERLINQLTEQKKSKVIALFNWKKVVSAAAVAACLILMFNLFSKPANELSFDTLEMASIESYLEDSDYTSYELSAMLSEENLTKDNFINNELDEELLEDYLLESITYEDLISN